MKTTPTTLVYWRPDLVVEPLIHQWYAWHFLLAPMSAALTLTRHHLPIMQTFVANPASHVRALQNPAMSGSFYMCHGAERQDDVHALLERTRNLQAPLLRLSEAIYTLAGQLTDAKGDSHEARYAAVPEPLRGLVELTYDWRHQPGFRVIEGLVYRSEYYATAGQAVALSLVGDRPRPFFLGTPRLAMPDQCVIPLPFADPGMDVLGRAFYAATPFGELVAALGIAPSDEDRLAEMVTTEAPKPIDRFQGKGVRIRYFGHACLLIETADVVILTDPAIGAGQDGSSEHYCLSDLPESIDVVVITHAHTDHFYLETLLPLRHRIGRVLVPKTNPGSILDPSLKLMLQQIGFRHVQELDELERFDVPGGTITALPLLGEHADLAIAGKQGFAIRVADRTIAVLADSNTLEPRLYERLHDIMGDVDVLFLGMECDGAPASWIYGPMFLNGISRKDDQSRRINGADCNRALSLVAGLRARQVYIYAMGLEPWLTHITSLQYDEQSKPMRESDRFVAACRAQGRTAERLYLSKDLYF